MLERHVSQSCYKGIPIAALDWPSNRSILLCTRVVLCTPSQNVVYWVCLLAICAGGVFLSLIGKSVRLKRTGQTKEECRKHLQSRLEMAKKRYNKGHSTDVGMIEISENGVIKKILVPLASISSKAKRRPFAINKIKSKTSISIAPKSTTSEASVSALPPGSISDLSSDASVMTVGHNLPVCSSLPCTNVLAMPQTSCLSTSDSFMQSFQTFVINSTPIIISSNGSQPSKSTFPTSFQQQPLMLASKNASTSNGTSFILQSSFSPIIQIPSSSQIQLMGNPTVISPLQSLNQPQLYTTQHGVQNAVYISSAKPLVLNQTNQLFTHNVQTASTENANVKSTRPRTVVEMLTQLDNSRKDRVLNLSNIKVETKNQQDKGRKTFRVKAILPKTSDQETQKKLSPDKQNLINKLTLAAERTSTLSFPFNSNVQFSLTSGAKLPNRNSSCGCISQVQSTTNKQKQCKHSFRLRAVQNLAKSRMKGLAGREKKLEASKEKSTEKCNSKSALESKLFSSDSDALSVLGNQVATVLLKQISIPPGVTTAKVDHVNLLNKASLNVSKIKCISTYRSIQPKPSNPVDKSIPVEEKMQTDSNGEESVRLGLKKCQKYSDESDSDYTIARMLDNDGSWSEEEDGCRGKIECESRKRRSGRLVDKSYKCYLGRAVDSSKYPRTRSFFKSKRSV